MGGGSDDEGGGGGKGAKKKRGAFLGHFLFLRKYKVQEKTGDYRTGLKEIKGDFGGCALNLRRANYFRLSVVECGGKNEGLTMQALTIFQQYRAALGLPYEGAQPACVYVSMHDASPLYDQEGKISGLKQFAVIVPETYDLPDRKAIEALMARAQRDAVERLCFSGSLQTVNCTFVPGIDSGGKSLHGATYTNSFLMEPERSVDTDARVQGGQALPHYRK